MRPLVLALALVSAACSGERAADRLVVYAAVDRTTAAPLLEAFEAASGARVDVVYDSEAAKTVGLAKRLELERDHPRADVWWSGETLYTALLESAGCFEPCALDGLPAREPDVRGECWVGFGARLRVLVYRRDLWPWPDEPPRGLTAMTDPRLAGRVVLARPTVGTSATHAAWLASRAEGSEWLDDLAANGPLLVAGNAHVVEAVLRGQALLGLTDSDDALIARARDPRLVLVVPDGPVVFTPSSAAVVRGAARGDLAGAFVRFLASEAGERALAASPARHVPLARALAPPAELPRLAELELAELDYRRLAEGWTELQRSLAERLGR